MGTTLLEMLAVVLVLSLLAGLVAPYFSNNEKNLVDSAALEVVAALRFAQSESIKYAQYYGVRIDSSSHQIRVFKLESPTTTPTESYTVYHPLHKQLYNVDVNSNKELKSVELEAEFEYAGGSKMEAVTFDPFGEPVSSLDLLALELGVVRVTLGDFIQSVTVCRLTGKIFVSDGGAVC